MKEEHNETNSFGTFIKRKRIEWRMTQSDLAREVGCGQSAISGIERGDIKQSPRHDTLRRLAEALNANMDSLIERLYADAKTRAAAEEAEAEASDES